MSITVRPIEQNDKSRWRELWCGAEDSYLSFDGTLHLVSEEATETTFKRFLDPNEPVHCIVAESKGNIIGFANFITHRSTWSVADQLYVGDMYVSEKCRSRGAGHKMFEYIYEEAERCGYSKCYWTTASGNTRAQNLYDQIGTKFDRIQYIKPWK